MDKKERLKKQLDFIMEIDKVKNIFRQTYLADGKRKENDAEHSWHLALMAVLLKEYSNEEVDLSKVIPMVLAHDLVEQYGDSLLEKTPEERFAIIEGYGLPTNIARMERDLKRYKINYDVWFRESTLHESGYVKETIDMLTAKGATYETEDGALWLRSTDFGCDKDDVLRRANGFYTYFAADIAYHRNKFEKRGFDRVINIWGADHHGHVKRLQCALDALGLDYVVNEGDGAFYGPKIDFHLRDCLGRTWQCGTIQLDFQLPLRFDLHYTGADGEKHRPIMIHRVAFGSIERFIGILIEHFAGAFPTWLAPVQVEVIPISDKHLDYANKVLDTLKAAGIRTDIDTRAEKMGYKIREAQLQKIPYMLVVGGKEEENEAVSVRSRFKGDEGQMKLDDFLAAIKEEIANRENRKVEKED